MRTRLHMILIILAVLAVGAVIAKRAGILPERDASWIVRQSQERATLHSFSATAQTRISCRGKMMLSDVKITRMQPDKCRIEYMSEPLKGVVIVNNGGDAWRYDPKTERLVVSDNPGCARDAGKLQLLLDNYRVTSAGRERIAGRETYRLVVRPRDSGRIAKRLWVDTDTFVILRQEDYDSRGNLQSSTTFTSFRFAKSFPDETFEAPSKAKVIADRTLGGTMTIDKLSEAMGFAVRLPRYLPSGYKLDAYRLYACPCECPHQSAYIRYTNGLSSISVFESKAGSSCRGEVGCGESAGPMGSCQIKKADRDEIARMERDGISFVVLADMNARELKKIVHSL